MNNNFTPNKWQVELIKKLTKKNKNPYFVMGTNFRGTNTSTFKYMMKILLSNN